MEVDNMNTQGTVKLLNFAYLSLENKVSSKREGGGGDCSVDVCCDGWCWCLVRVCVLVLVFYCIKLHSFMFFWTGAVHNPYKVFHISVNMRLYRCLIHMLMFRITSHSTPRAHLH